MNFKNVKNFLVIFFISGIIISITTFTACDGAESETPPSDPALLAITATDPVNDASDVALNSAISVTFSEAVDPGTVDDDSFKVVSETVVSGTVSLSEDGRTAVFVPSSYLDYSTYYTVTLDASISGISGNTTGTDYVFGFTTETEADTDPSGPVTDPSDPGTDPVVDTSGDTVKMIFVGDINLGTKVGKSVVENGNGDYNFAFINVASYIKSFDLAFGNLESIISDKGETIKPFTGVDLRADPAAVDGLTGAGFDVVSVANNHIGDFGEEGMLDSFSRLKAAGISFAGGGLNYNEAHSPVIKEVRSTRIACLSYTNTPMYSDSVGLGQTPIKTWIATDSRPGIAWAASNGTKYNSKFAEYGDIEDMERDIKAAKLLADIVIVMIHFGWEYTYEPEDPEIEQARAAIDAGANLVIGSHPHVCQRVEEYHGGFIAYSLGNFVFDISEAMAEGVTRGMVVEASFKGGRMTDIRTRYSRINELYQVSIDE